MLETGFHFSFIVVATVHWRRHFINLFLLHLSIDSSRLHLEKGHRRKRRLAGCDPLKCSTVREMDVILITAIFRRSEISVFFLGRKFIEYFCRSLQGDGKALFISVFLRTEALGLLIDWMYWLLYFFCCVLRLQQVHPPCTNADIMQRKQERSLGSFIFLMFLLDRKWQASLLNCAMKLLHTVKKGAIRKLLCCWVMHDQPRLLIFWDIRLACNYNLNMFLQISIYLNEGGLWLRRLTILKADR